MRQEMRLEVIRWNGGPPPDEETVRQRMEAEGYDVFLQRDESGADYHSHSHDHDHTLWIIDGEMIVGAEGSEFHVRRGDRLIIPRGAVHTARAGGNGVTYVIGERR